MFVRGEQKGDGEYTAVKDEVKGVTTFSFKGLSAGGYKLVESTTPNGYNTMEDLVFEIVADSEENADGIASVTNLKMVGTDGGEIDNWNEDTATGVISSNIVNYTGATLPFTGGIGTIIFYLAGGMLVLIAGIVAVAKKKAEDE